MSELPKISDNCLVKFSHFLLRLHEAPDLNEEDYFALFSSRRKGYCSSATEQTGVFLIIITS